MGTVTVKLKFKQNLCYIYLDINMCPLSIPHASSIKKGGKGYLPNLFLKFREIKHDGRLNQLTQTE